MVQRFIRKKNHSWERPIKINIKPVRGVEKIIQTVEITKENVDEPVEAPKKKTSRKKVEIEETVEEIVTEQ